jgi:two-component system, chemotaxis family, chemotaxis protein CheY
VTYNNQSCRVVIADDNELMRNMLRAVLVELGAEIVSEAFDGNSAIQSFEDHHPDIMFLDIKMPGKDGIEALREIIEKNPAAKIVMLTAVTDISVADACVEAGAQGYIRKGATPNVFTIMLKAQLDEVLAG